MTNYRDFLERKRVRAQQSGFKPVWMPGFLKPFQVYLEEWAIQKGKAAIYADCGMGKGIIALVFLMNVLRFLNRKRGKTLIVAPLAVADQFVREGQKFGVDVFRTKQGELKSGINVTNFNRLHYYNPRDFDGVVIDEASILKNDAGHTRKQITEFLDPVPYRMLCTATPSPNDFMELGCSAEALGVMSYSQMLGMFFTNGGETTQQWEMKAHARKRFWQWVASWARAIKRPSDYGFEDEGFALPKLNIHKHILPSGKGMGFLPKLAKTLDEQREEKRKTLVERSEKVASLIPKGESSLVWCQLNPEGDYLEKIIPDCVQVAGKDSDDEKEEKIGAFLDGSVKCLITKAKIAGFGLNLQHCHNVFYYPSWCYSEDTEILTGRGWLSFGAVSLEDEVATVNPENQVLEWQNPTSVIWNPYVGDMVRFGNKESYSRGFDLLVTPNHRMYVQRNPVRYSSSQGWEIKEARWLQENYKRQEYRMLSVPKGFVGVDREWIEFPQYKGKLTIWTGEQNKEGDFRGTSINSIRGLDHRKIVNIPGLDTKTFMRLAGWYLSEGYCGSKEGELTGTVVITQCPNANPVYWKEIVDLLKSIKGLNIYSKSKDIRFCSKQIAGFLVENFGKGSHNKKIPRWVKELSPKYLEILRDTMLKGDGCSHEKGGKKWCYRTVSKRLADDFSEICLKTNTRGSVRYREGKNSEGVISGWFDVNLTRDFLEPSIHQQPQLIPYNGMIGCVSVPNGLVVVRRNGIPVVSGNSFEEWYQAIRRCWRFGQQHEVECHIVSTEAQRLVLNGMLRKEKQSDELFSGIVREMVDVIKHTDNEIGNQPMRIPAWLKSC